jgi:transposase
MRVAWRTVGAIVARVSADAEARTDRLAGLTRIGIDELSDKKGRVTISNFEERLADELPFGD